MILSPETVTIPDILALTRHLSAADRHWLAELLSRLDDEPLPEQATLEEAIALYLADACSLGRAAELAGVTRWDIIDQLKARGIPLLVYDDGTAEEMDALAEQLAREGFL
jgi:predicted HTH domain antitoxin